MKKSELASLIREELLSLVKEEISEIERPDNEISTAEREQIEHEAIKQIAKKSFGKDYDKLPGRDKLAAGRKFLDDSEKQKGRLQKALKSLQAKGKIDPNKVYTPGTFYEGIDDIEDEEKAHKAATKGGKKPSKKDKKEGDIIKNYKEIESKVKDSIKKAKGGDKEALNYLLSKQPIIKAYNDLKKSKNIF